MLCREQSLVKLGDGWGVAAPLRCRSWGCPECAPIRRIQVIREAESGQPNRMITLTSALASGPTVEARAAALADAWRKTVKRAKRHFNMKTLEYFAVFEKTQRGEPHLHILARCAFIPQNWLSITMKEMIGAPIVDIRSVNSERGAARYIAKYVGKDLHRFGSCKRYWSTRAYDLGRGENDPTDPWRQAVWQVVAEPLWAIRERWLREHRSATALGDEMLWYGSPPAEGPWRPRENDAWAAPLLPDGGGLAALFNAIRPKGANRHTLPFRQRRRAAG